MKVDGYTKFCSPFKDRPVLFIIQIIFAIIGMGLPALKIKLLHGSLKLISRLFRTLWGKGCETQEPIGIALYHF